MNQIKLGNKVYQKKKIRYIGVLIVLALVTIIMLAVFLPFSSGDNISIMFKQTSTPATTIHPQEE